MSIDQSGLAQRTGTTGSKSSGGGGSPSDKAMAALDQTGEVAAGAADAGKQVAHEAKQQASQVLGQAKEQLHTIVGQARTEMHEQMGSKAGQAAGSLRSFSDQLTALRTGNPAQASQLTGYLDEAQHKVASLADRLEQEGVQGIVDDVARFARRRPGLFLLGAATVGFAVGRTMRAGMAAAHDGDGHASTSGQGETWRAGTLDDTRSWAAPAESMPGTFAAPSGAATTPLVTTPTVPVPATPATGTAGLRTP